MPIDTSIRKVMVIGSGPIVIGQAAEFDYAGAQACRVLHDAGVNVVLVNSNPATIMTDKALADEIYLEPLTLTSVKRIIEKEQPDSLLAGLGGQTGLTLAMELDKEGFLQQHNVRLIGTNAAAIDKAEDRELFKETMAAIGEPTIPSGIANTVAEALEVADSIGYPVIIRPAFTLGGAGGGVAYSAEELALVAQTGSMRPRSRRSSSSAISTAGRRSSLRPCATAPATSSPCAAWKTSTPSACTPATASSSPRR